MGCIEPGDGGGEAGGVHGFTGHIPAREEHGLPQVTSLKTSFITCKVGTTSLLQGHLGIRGKVGYPGLYVYVHNSINHGGQKLE